MVFAVGVKIAKEPLRVMARSGDLGVEAKRTQAIFLYHVTKSSFVRHPPG